MDAPRTRTAPFLLGLVAILAALPLGYFLFLREPPPPPAPPPPPVEAKRPVEKPAERAPLALKLEKIEGTVEVRRGGTWRAAVEQESLQASDTVRTRDGSYAILLGGKALEVRMEEGTEVSVEALTDTLSRLVLGAGMTQVRLRPGSSQKVEVAASGSDAEVSTEEGLFTLSNNGSGTVALATQEGETRFSGQRQVVIVRAGQQSIVLPGRGPSAPTPIPSSLLLKVNWPARPRRQVVVSGETEPGTHVAVGGQRVSADAQGRFSLQLSLQEGANPIRVRARSVGGRLQEEQRALSVDTTPPRPVTVDPGLWNDPPPTKH